jgi:hypothetical protein
MSDSPWPAPSLSVLTASQFSRSMGHRDPTDSVPAGSMRIKSTSIMVDDQDKALRFYTEILGFR